MVVAALGAGFDEKRFLKKFRIEVIGPLCVLAGATCSLVTGLGP